MLNVKFIKKSISPFLMHWLSLQPINDGADHILSTTSGQAGHQFLKFLNSDDEKAQLLGSKIGNNVGELNVTLYFQFGGGSNFPLHIPLMFFLT